MTAEVAPDPAFEALLEFLKRNRGFDFLGYKRASLMRRITKRMREIPVSDFAAYTDYLEVHPDEFTLLFNTILINVTAFFRDSDSWEYLAGEVLPRLLEEKSGDEPIRVWSAGCASGEEAYSIAILLAEALGVSEFRRRVKIYATDIDEEALDAARRAIYSASDLKPLSAERIERFFVASGESYTFRPELRRSVIFGRHDLVKDPPMSRLDLIICRNVLMYLNAETQGGVFARFHFALKPTGVLFLGRAEMLLSHSDLFMPLELKHRIFSRVLANARRDRLVALAQEGNPVAEDRLARELYLRAGAFDALNLAQLVIDAEGRLVLANRRAKELFEFDESDMNQPIQDFEVSYRPLELRSLIDRAHQEGQSIRVADVERPVGDEIEHFEVEVTPIGKNGGSILGTTVLFTNTTRRFALEERLRKSAVSLEETTQAYHSTTEELETTNEELQSTNEELETTNEELQSSNEELETMNEELQSTNEELRTMNEVLQDQSHELNHLNAFLESVLAGLRAACVVVDETMAIRVWKEKVEDMWGLRAEEVEGQSLMDLDIGLPVAELRGMIEACLRGEPNVPPKVVDAVNRRGRAFRCTVTATPLLDSGDAIGGAILLMEMASGKRNVDERSGRVSS